MMRGLPQRVRARGSQRKVIAFITALIMLFSLVSLAATYLYDDSVEMLADYDAPSREIIFDVDDLEDADAEVTGGVYAPDYDADTVENESAYEGYDGYARVETLEYAEIASLGGSLGLNAFNNGNNDNASLANLGVIRVWTQLDGANALVRYEYLDVTATFPNGDCAMDYVRVNNMWNNPGFVNLIDVSKAGNWHWINLIVTYDGETVELRLFNNNRVFGLHIFNNGPGGTPFTPNNSLAASGTIRMWTQIDGANAQLPNSSITVSAVDQSGANANEHVTVNVVPWYNPINIQTIDVTKNGSWERIYLEVTHMDQTLEIVLVNSRFFSLDIFNNGSVELGATPSRPNANLATGGTIRMWTQLMRENARVPYAALNVTAQLPNGNCAMEFITINRPWNDQDNVNFIDADKNAPWQRIYLTATLFGQTVNVVLVNETAQTFELNIFNNGPVELGATPSTPNASLALGGTIRMWTQLDNVNAQIPIAWLNVEAVDQDGNDAMEFINAPNVGGSGYTNRIDANKHAPWQRIYLTVMVLDQVVEVVLVNSSFNLDMFNNGPLGSPSTPNESLAEAGLIRMWTQVNGVGAPISHAIVESTAAATFQGTDECALHLFTFHATGENSNAIVTIDVNKNALWEFIDFEITVFGQTIELVLHNANFVSESTVTFVVQNGAVGIWSDTVTTVDIENGQQILPAHIPNYVARTGFYFAGWYMGEYPDWVPQHPENHTVADDVTFTARFNLLWHPVTFTIGEGGAAETIEQPIRDGTSIAEAHINPPGALSLETPLPGWRFVEWLPENPVGIFPTGPMEFTAVFELYDNGPVIPSVNVIFDAGGGTGSMAGVSVLAGEDFYLPANAFTAPSNHEFYGWFVTGYADPLGSQNPGDVIKVGTVDWADLSVTVTAVWIPIVPMATVNFDAGGGTGTMQSVDVSRGDTFILPGNAFTAPDGFEFYGWWVSGYSYPLGTMAPGTSIEVGNGSVTALALWIQSTTSYFVNASSPRASVVNVIFIPGNGIGTMLSVPVPTGDTFILPDNEFIAPDGYVFYEWFVEGYANPGGAMNPGDVITVGTWADTSVYVTAIWERLPPMTTVYFDSGDGSGTMSSVDVLRGATFTLPDNAFEAPDGYEFYAWWLSGYSDPLGTAAPGTSIIVGNGPVTVLALWTPLLRDVFVSYILVDDDDHYFWTVGANVPGVPVRHYLVPYNTYFNFSATDKNVVFADSENEYAFLGWAVFVQEGAGLDSYFAFNPDYLDFDTSAPSGTVFIPAPVVPLFDFENLEFGIELQAVWVIYEREGGGTSTPPVTPPAAGGLPATGIEGGNIVLWSTLLALATMGVVGTVMIISKVDVKKVAKKLNLR